MKVDTYTHTYKCERIRKGLNKEGGVGPNPTWIKATVVYQYVEDVPYGGSKVL